MNRKISARLEQDLAEGGRLDYPLAGIHERALAYAVDLAFQILFLVVSGIALMFLGVIFAFRSGPSHIFQGIFLLEVFVVWWLYPVICEVRYSGRTLGKRFLGLKVVRVNGYSLSWGVSMVRNLLRMTDFLPALGIFPSGLVGVGAMLVSGRMQRLGDMVAGTLVVRQPLQTKGRLMAKAAGLWNRIKAGKGQSSPFAGISPVPVTVELSRAEKQALVSFAQRWTGWSVERRRDLAGRLSELSGGATDQGVARLVGMGMWLMGEKKPGADESPPALNASAFAEAKPALNAVPQRKRKLIIPGTAKTERTTPR